MKDDSMFSIISRISRDLEAERIAHALTGSVAAGLFGEPVTSLDIDFVVIMDSEDAIRAARRWRDLCADEETFANAARTRQMVNLLHFPSGLKIDISPVPSTLYFQEVFRRRTQFSMPPDGEAFWVVSPEDIILMKLVWRKDSRSEKQWANALSVCRIRGHRLDWAYLRQWARELEVESDLHELMRQAGV